MLIRLSHPSVILTICGKYHNTFIETSQDRVMFLWAKWIEKSLHLKFTNSTLLTLKWRVLIFTQIYLLFLFIDCVNDQINHRCLPLECLTCLVPPRCL
ncbi:hypothetical protein K501DRAFT_29258 [Backusella circina FSU 941]|nr:hypothetical protein K501DRAFT_29258 [Backusella circina FSU 941]